MLRGSLTALVTPFEKSGRFDEKAFRAFVEWQIEQGTQGLIPLGSALTGFCPHYAWLGWNRRTPSTGRRLS